MICENMIVMKFGGTSVGSADAIRNLGKIVKNQLDKAPIIVVSAVSKVTDLLIETAKSAAAGKDYSQNLIILKEKHIAIIGELKLALPLVNELLGEAETHFREIK